MTGLFRADLSSLKFVQGFSGRMLRCTLTLAFWPTEGPREPMGMSIDGCLVVRGKTGDLEFSTPTTTFGRGGKKAKMVALTPALVKRLLDRVRATRYDEYIGGTQVPTGAQVPDEVEPGLPETLEVDE